MATKSENIDVLRPGKYVGQTLNQVRHGQGKYVYDNTFFTYDGSWVEGKILVCLLFQNLINIFLLTYIPLTQVFGTAFSK